MDGYFTDQSDLGADLEPMTVAAGDVTQTTAILWAHSHTAGTVTIEYSTDSTFATGVTSISKNLAAIRALPISRELLEKLTSSNALRLLPAG